MKKCKHCRIDKPWWCYARRSSGLDVIVVVCLDCMEEEERKYNRNEAVKFAIVDGMQKWFELPLTKRPFIFTTEMLESVVNCIYIKVIKAIEIDESKK